ncbi:Cyclopropane fatty acid synthase [Sphingomonas paucimobilis]|nr:Cyclopropane fatty acid synthase [Sphingomonas paucimobilis]
MIVPDRPATAAHVAVHYEELDLAYRRMWGDHVHHGYWRSGKETPQEAAAALAVLVEEHLALRPGHRVCDIGCGYGATAAAILGRHDVTIIGLTLSAAQQRIADGRAPGFACLLRDWLDNGLESASFDRAYAIESSEHMTDKGRFFTEARRILRPSGRLVVCAWLEGPHVTPWQARHLLLPICREGRLPSMGSREDYVDLAARAGFVLTGYQDISRQVRRTWLLCLMRLMNGLAIDRDIRRLALSRATRNRDFMFSLPRLLIALRTGAMRYGVFQWEAR